MNIIQGLTTQFSENVQYVLVPILIIVGILVHLHLRKYPQRSIFILPLIVYIGELIVFYIARMLAVYYNAYDTGMFTALSSIIRLQFFASYLIIFAYMDYRDYRSNLWTRK